MKKCSLIIVLLCVTCGLLSCSKNEEPYVPQEVNLKLDYTFLERGCLSRASGSEEYTAFYEKYIKTKQLTPTTYALTFENTEGKQVAIIRGMWKNNDGVRLVEGDYKVTGTSNPSTSVSDTVSISFSETVHISKDMTNITLTAIYDSYLLMLDKDNYSDAYYHGYNSSGVKQTTMNLCKTDENLILFVRSITSYDYNHLVLTRNDGFKSTIYLNNLPFEKGKYYYFNDMTNSFDIPPMESGN